MGELKPINPTKAQIVANPQAAAHDYNTLSNKPQINGVVLEGDKNSEELGLQETITAAGYLSVDGGTLSFDDMTFMVKRDALPKIGIRDANQSGFTPISEDDVSEYTTGAARQIPVAAAGTFFRAYGGDVCTEMYQTIDWKLYVKSYKLVGEHWLGMVWREIGDNNTVVIPDGTTVVTRDMIQNRDVERVVFPNGVTEIAADVFNGCKNLRYIENTDSVEVIGDRAFFGCMNLQFFYTHLVDVAIGEEAFVGCVSLRWVSGDIKSIGDRAFVDCYTLCKIELGQVESIGENAFTGCASLPKSLTISGNMSVIGALALEGCPSIETLIIPETVTRIEDTNFFNNCENLTDIILLGTPALKTLTMLTINGCLRCFIRRDNAGFFVTDPVWLEASSLVDVRTIEDNLDYFRNKGIDMTKYGYSWPES